MRKNIVITVVIGVFVLTFGLSISAAEITWKEIGRDNLDLKTVLVNPEAPGVILIGSKKGIFKSQDWGDSWRSVLSIRGQNKEINLLLYGPRDKNSIYAASTDGLYYSYNQGESWMRIFRGKNYLQNNCGTLAVLPESIYLGTKQGLFVSSDKGRSWRKETGEIGNSQILSITYNTKEENYIYVACIGGVFRTQDAGKSWKKVFLAYTAEDGGQKEGDEEDADEEAKNSIIRYINCDQNNSNYLYLATGRGVYQSRDKGQTWDLMPSSGLLGREVKFLLISRQSIIYAVTKSGIFEYSNGHWQELSLGLAAEDVRFLALDKDSNLYAACDKGLFKTDKVNFSENLGDNPVVIYYKDEPKINEIQQAAIKYAEVEPEKIKEWRKKAKMKAVLPRLTVGIDSSEADNYEIYTSATTRYVYEGPDDKSSGWDITLSWELGDLIWSEAQTSIDVRSRLMVQLRDDILDEVTKIYFERLRVKIELDNLSIEDRKKRLERELKLQELTASLDALTGGYFSQQLKNKS
ncbi:MAG: hypothetical protein PHU96_06825 [Candidatus Omnitrophica bacterium]|nr:hypothetical protein [Candidatus Omnitrophota bacterium]